MKKILVCGLGSIGQRHVRQIKKLLNNKIEIRALRLRKQNIVITDQLQVKSGVIPEDEYNLKVFYSIDEAFNWKPDVVFITNPISMHIETAILAAEVGASIFIEKPLGCSLKGLSKLKKLVEEKNLTCMIGYQMRYHPGYKKAKEIIAKGTIGEIIYGDFHFGEWLPGMHPYEDYKTSHASKKEQGGGVIFCLSHKIDLAYWMFGLPFSIYALGGKISNLELNVEDNVDIMLGYKNAKYRFPLHIHLDFIQNEKKCYLNIIGNKGSVYFDYCKNELILNINNKQESIITYNEFQRNDMFMMELKDFFSCIKSKEDTPITLNDGINVLEICLKSHNSLKNNLVEFF